MSPVPAEDCTAPASADLVRVRYVHDGDTLTLDDGRKVRVIGINAPELDKDGTNHQPLAIAARDSLRRRLFLAGQQVRLLPGAESRDHYGRLLAHVFTPGGDNLGAALAEEGLALALAITPNVWGLDCYWAAEDKARSSKRGLWALPEYAPRESRDLGLRSEGFQLVRGKVVRVGNSRDAKWVNLEGSVAVRVAKDDARDFPWDLRTLIGKRIEVRGWFAARRGELRTTVHHPRSLVVLSPPAMRREPDAP